MRRQIATALYHNLLQPSLFDDVDGEYIGFDEDTGTLRSHFMNTNGANFTYTWAVEGDTVRIWFGDKDSDNLFVGHFDKGRASYAGKWQWPGGGYEAKMTRIPG